MRRLPTALVAVVVVALVLSIIGYGYAQDEGKGTTTSGCCAMASAVETGAVHTMDHHHPVVFQAPRTCAAAQ